MPRDADCDVGAFEFTDFTRVRITLDPSASLDRMTGSAVVRGTVKCSRDEALGLLVKLEQQLDGNPPFVVKGTGGLGIPCSTTAKRWSTTVASPDAGFSTGSAVASASTNDVPVWVTPATTSRSLKLQSK